MDTQKKVLGLNKDCRDLPYLTGRLMGVVTHYAEKRYGPSTLGEMFKWPKRYIDIFMTYVNKRDPYLKEIAVAPLAKMDTLQQGQAYIGYYHQLAAYDRDEREKHQSITDKLRALRKQRGMTQKELAAKCGTQQQRIAEIESGEFSPTLDTLKPILKALDAELLLHDLSAHERGLLKFKVGDKIEIQCRKSRLLHIKKIYDGEVGTITEIWPGNPYGEYCVKLPNGCNNSFFADELKPKGEE